jgi:hypothetical protein
MYCYLLDVQTYFGRETHPFEPIDRAQKLWMFGALLRFLGFRNLTAKIKVSLPGVVLYHFTQRLPVKPTILKIPRARDVFGSSGTPRRVETCRNRRYSSPTYLTFLGLKKMNAKY